MSAWRGAHHRAARFIGARPLRIRRIAFALASCAALGWLGVAAARAHFTAPEPTLLVRDRLGRFLGELPASGDDRLGYWPIATLPERVAAATLAIEDRRFAWHPGVDPAAIARALAQNLRSRSRVSGASTIAMQVARMQAPSGRSYLRKAIEATTAVLLTARYGREDVLKQYLTIVPYGNRIHGIGYAARRYLDKPIEDLSWAEVAFLAAIPQSPARMNPLDPLGRVRAIRRGKEILARLHERRELSTHDLEVARREIDGIAIPTRAERPASTVHALLHFARRTPPAERRARPLLDTTLDLDLQNEVEWIAFDSVRDAERFGAGNAAVIVVERGTWRVVAAVSSVDYFDGTRAGAIDYLRLPRSSGSTLKPFLYAAALEHGTITPASIVDDLEPGPGGILNSDDRFLGPMLPRVALANSRNVPAVALLSRLGLDRFYDLLGDLGLHRRASAPDRYGLGLAIGALPVTLEQLVTAYTTLAGDGRLRSLAWTTPPAGLAADPGRPIFDEDTARLVTLFLSDPQARLPTFPRMGLSEYPFPVAIKTGTSSRYRDAWTIAWSERYLVGVWVGHPSDRPMTQLSGYRVAGRLAQRIVEFLHRDEMDGISPHAFPPPRGYRNVKLCALSGALATPACDRVVLEWIPKTAPPLADCTVHRRVGFDRATGKIARATTPASALAVRTLVDLPARYAPWLLRQGVPSLAAAEGRSPFASAPRDSILLPDIEANLRITSPEPNVRLLVDPETPRGESTLALRAVVDPPVAQVVWYVDGRPWATVDAPYGARWPLAPGDHVVEARVPFTSARSRPVRFRVD